MKTITTLEIAERFNKLHRCVLKQVRGLNEYEDSLISDLFSLKSYQNKQNKPMPMYEMGLNGFCLLTDTWGYSRGDSAKVKAEILAEFGETFVVVGSARTRHEDNFYHTLKEFLHKDKVMRQFRVDRWIVDFYLPDYFLFIEYDEEQHFSKKARDDDEARQKGITEFMREQYDEEVPPTFIRVKKGCEMQGLSEIMAQIAIATPYASGVTKYAS